MHLLAGITFGLLLVGGVAFVAALLRAERARVLAILSGAELARARAPRPIRVSAPLRLARAAPSRPRRTPLAAAA